MGGGMGKRPFKTPTVGKVPHPNSNLASLRVYHDKYKSKGLSTNSEVLI